MILRLLWWLLLLPLQLLILLAAAAIDGFRLLIPVRRPARATETAVESELCSIVVLNWNGKHLLQESLPVLRKAVEFTGKSHEVLVVDNGSDDGSSEWLRSHHPWVRLLELPENLGFGEGNNRGVEAASHPVAILLNNDMLASRDFIEPLLRPFSDPLVFATSCQIFFPPGKAREETGNTRGRWSFGYLHLSHDPVERAHQRRYNGLPVLWAGGGSAAFHRERFLQLGGFSKIFSPCYLEDTDLSYRAWRRGWKVVFAPDSRVLHKHRSSSSSRFQPQELEGMIQQRKLWYIWKNYPWSTLAGHFLWIALHFGRHLRPRDYLSALRKLPTSLLSRLGEPSRRLSNRTLFRWVQRPLSYLNECYPDRRPLHRGEDGRRLHILIVSAYLPHLGKHGGAGRVFQLLSRVAQQHDVSLVCFVETREELQEVSQVAPYCRRIETVYRRQFEPLSMFPYEPFEEFNTRAFREVLTRVLAEEDFDLVHFEWTQMVLYADLFPNIPKLVTEIEVNYAAHQSLVRVEPRLLRKIKRYYDTLQTLRREVEACRQVNKVICVTDVDRDFLKGYVDTEKLEVVNTGVDTGYFSLRPGPRPDPDAIVYVGAFRHEPNIDAMLHFTGEIFPLILEERPHTQLYIVGSSPPSRIQRLEEESENVTVTGFVEDIREYYDLAQVVIVPLRTGVGIRGKILEGWAAEKGMVATSLACLGIRAVHGENILIADHPQEFAMWTVALLDHPEHCRRLGKAGRETVVRFYEWDTLGLQMSHLYEELIAPPRGLGRRSPRSHRRSA